MSNDKIIVEQDLLRVMKWWKWVNPCLITIEKDIYQPRLPSYKLKLATAERAVNILTHKDLEEADDSLFGLEGSPHSGRTDISSGSKTRTIFMGGAPDELVEKIVEKLHETKFV